MNGVHVEAKVDKIVERLDTDLAELSKRIFGKFEAQKLVQDMEDLPELLVVLEAKHVASLRVQSYEGCCGRDLGVVWS